MFIKLDHQTIPIPGNNIINSIDYLFKFFWVFNTCYASQLLNLMYFFELIFKITKNFKPSVNEFYNIITAQDITN